MRCGYQGLFIGTHRMGPPWFKRGFHYSRFTDDRVGSKDHGHTVHEDGVSH